MLNKKVIKMEQKKKPVGWRWHSWEHKMAALGMKSRLWMKEKGIPALKRGITLAAKQAKEKGIPFAIDKAKDAIEYTKEAIDEELLAPIEPGGKYGGYESIGTALYRKHLAGMKPKTKSDSELLEGLSSSVWSKPYSGLTHSQKRLVKKMLKTSKEIFY
jgi:hypothetical protein